jgi:hypothetical protein
MSLFDLERYFSLLPPAGLENYDKTLSDITSAGCADEIYVIYFIRFVLN